MARRYSLPARPSTPAPTWVRSRRRSPTEWKPPRRSSPPDLRRNNPLTSCSIGGRELVLRLGFEIAGVVAFVQLARWLAGKAVDHATALDGRPLVDHVGPALDVLVLVHRQELGRAVLPKLGQPAIPGKDGNVGDRIAIAGHVFALRQPAIEHIEQAFRLHREAIDRIFDLDRRVGVEVAKAAADVGRAAHLPEQPRQTFGAGGRLRWQELAEFLGQVHQDRAGLEDPDRLGTAAVDQRRDLGIRVRGDKAAAELIAVAYLDQPGIVLRALMTEGQQLFEHDRNLDAIRCAQGVELQRVAADRQLLLVRGARGWPVDVLEPAAIWLGPTPDFGGRVFGGVGHS